MGVGGDIVNVECSVLLKITGYQYCYMAARVVPILLHGCRVGTTYCLMMLKMLLQAAKIQPLSVEGRAGGRGGS